MAKCGWVSLVAIVFMSQFLLLPASATAASAASTASCRVSVAAIFPSATGSSIVVALRRDDFSGPLASGALRLFHGFATFDVAFDAVNASGPDGSIAAATPIVVRVPMSIDGAVVTSIEGRVCPPYRPWTTARQSTIGSAVFVEKISGVPSLVANPASDSICAAPDVSASEVEHALPDVGKIAANYGQRSVRLTVLVLVGGDGRVIDAKLSPDTVVGIDLGRAAVDAARRSRYTPTRFRCVPVIDEFIQVYEFVGR